MLFDQKELQLLEGVIPTFDRVKPGFISVLKAHSETNLTNLLAYLFKGEDYPQLQEIFLQAFIDCVDLETDEDNFLYEMIDDGFEDIEVYSEYPTKSGRIDILVIKKRKNQSERSAIIIENKLYHELNNDFDDYFYSVIEDFNILPKNIAVVALTLKPFDHAFPGYMKKARVLHKYLKEAVKASYDKSQIDHNDISVQFFVDEYLMHIDDLYLERDNNTQEKSFAFYTANRKVINSIVGKIERPNPEDAEPLSKLEDKVEQVLKIQRSVHEYAKESFKRYIAITNRSVQGVDYFRGRDTAFDAIRYKLDFENHFIGDDSISLQVWLNESHLLTHGIDINDTSYKGVLDLLGVKHPLALPNNGSWFSISLSKHEIDETILQNIFKDKIENEWEQLEGMLSESTNKSLTEKFNKSVITFLNAGVGFASEINTADSSVNFSYSTTDTFIQYSIKHSPPDLVEILLYVENNYWEKVKKNLTDLEEFIAFDEVQSYRISEIKKAQLGGESRNYDALVKRSYRIKSLNEVPALLSSEKVKWTEVEKQVVEIIDGKK